MEKISYILGYYPDGNFLIQIVNFYELNMSQILVFWKDNILEFKNARITDAIVIDETVIELEILHNSGRVNYYYFEPTSSTSIKLDNKNSKIIRIRNEHIEGLQESQRQLWEDENLELILTTEKNN